jgi:hypothetical protein
MSVTVPEMSTPSRLGSAIAWAAGAFTGGPTAIDVSASREVASGVIAYDRSARWWQAGAHDPSEAGPNAAVRASQAVFSATRFTVKWIQRPS